MIHLTDVLVDAWMDSYWREPAAITLDIDDTCDVIHRRQQLSLFDAHYQAGNLIKLHKTQLASDRTSCRSALASQVRLVLHTAAYWLMLTVRDAIPKTRELATAEFTALRLHLLKIAAGVVETATLIRLAFAAASPEADLFRGLSGALIPLGP